MAKNRHRLESGDQAKAFVLAGKATITLVSKVTGTRFTYRVTKGEFVPSNNAEEMKVLHFVSVLSAPDDYTFLGTIFEETNYRHGRRSPFGEDAPSARAFAWCWKRIANGELPTNVEIWHEGRCGRCGRALTVPQSIETGIGPVCASY